MRVVCVLVSFLCSLRLNGDILVRPSPYHTIRRFLFSPHCAGVQSVDIDMEKQTVKVQATVPSETCLATIQKTGKKVAYVSSQPIA